MPTGFGVCQVQVILGDPGTVTGNKRKSKWQGKKVKKSGEKARSPCGMGLTTSVQTALWKLPSDWAEKILCVILPNWRAAGLPVLIWTPHKSFSVYHICLVCFLVTVCLHAETERSTIKSKITEIEKDKPVASSMPRLVQVVFYFTRRNEHKLDLTCISIR